MDKKSFKFIIIGAIITAFVIKFQNGIIWDSIIHLFGQLWALIYPKISGAIAFFLVLSPYSSSIVTSSDFTRWLMNMGTLATIGATLMYIRCSNNSKLFILWKIFYILIFFYVTWFANCVMLFFWQRIADEKQLFAIVSIALFNILLWLAGYYIFFRSLMAKEKIL